MINMASPRIIRTQYAGFISRFIAFMSDLFIIAALSMIVTTSFEVIIAFFSLDGVILGEETGQAGLSSALRIGSTLIGSTIFAMIYFLFFWSVAGFTPGKAFLGLRIVQSDGQRMGLGRAFVRLLAYWISALLFFLGFAWIIVDNRRQGWHDKIAGTIVVYDWEFDSRSPNFGEPLYK